MKKKRRLLVKVLLAGLLSLLLAEGGMRFLLFTEQPWLIRRAKSVRRAANFADNALDDDYWKLLVRLNGKQEGSRPNFFDERVGWIGNLFRENYVHKDASDMGARRPLLLFGDSFTQCVTPPQECWQGWMESSPFNEVYDLLNYGVGGYGFDQMVFLMEAVLPAFQAQQPVIAIGVFTDSDLERSYLSFREWPKCRFQLDAQDNLLPPQPVFRDGDEFLRKYPISITSYLWSFVVHNRHFLSQDLRERLSGLRRKREEMYLLNRKLLERAIGQLEQAGVEYFFVLFQGKPNVARHADISALEVFFVDELEKRGVRYLLSKPLLYAAARRDGCSVDDYFIGRGRGIHHFNARGNQVVFEAFERGLRGERDDWESLRLWEMDRCELGTAEDSLSFERGGATNPSETRLRVRLSEQGSAKLSYRLNGHCKRLTGRIGLENFNSGQGLEVQIHCDGRPSWSSVLREGGLEQSMDVDLTQVTWLEIRLVPLATSKAPLEVALSNPRVSLTRDVPTR